ELNENIEDAEIMDDFNPLDEPVIEKAYSRPNVRVSAKDLQGDIPEPSFIPPPLSEPMLEQEKVKKVDEPFNKEMKELPNKDKTAAAEKVAKMIMQGYRFINKMADDALQFNERKLAKLQREGQIDLNAAIPVSATDIMSAGEFIQEYNMQTKDTITVSKEFEEEATPVLIRVLAKRGVGMTDEQYLGYLFIKDAASKGFLISQSLSAKKEILNLVKEAMVVQNGYQTPPTNNTQQPQQNYQQEEVVQEPQQNDYEVEQDYSVEENTYDPTNVNDFVNSMTGGTATNEIQESEIEKPKSDKPTIILPTNTSAKGKRGRPKRK
ncbi:MAG: hypothetical protein LLF94_10900, partial [Chlamydiales bacterium]|nr:hypothetical protein [Chlamydiales bacterium]